jgi:type IV secretion system protein VirB10
MADQAKVTEEDRGARAPDGSSASARKRAQLLLAGGIGVFGLVVLGALLRGAIYGMPAAVQDTKRAEAKVRHEEAPPMQTARVTSAAPSRAEPMAPAITVQQADALLEAAQRAPVTAYSRTLPVAGAQGAADGSVMEPQEAEDRGAFEKRFKSPAFAGAKAGHIGDRRFIVAQGTSIPCVMETAMQSDQAGFVSCTIPRDVLSDNGQIVLMEKGTQVVGEYRGGLQQGQTRLHVLWSRAKTPTGVVVDLGSAATDALGRAGVGGVIDTHFWERMSAAMLLSIVSDGSSIAAARIQKAAGVQSSAAGQAPNSAAAVAVEQSAAIKPTLHKNQGEMVSIFVARDLDFSSIYTLKVVKNTGAWENSPHFEAPSTVFYSGQSLK